MFKLAKSGMQARRKMPAQPAKSFHWRKSYNWLLLLIPFAFGALYLTQTDQVLPIRTIQLSGTFKHLDQRNIEDALRPYIGQGFFSLDIHQLRKGLEERPWTDKVSVRRVWPDKLRVTITEKKPLARWGSGHLLSDQATVFAADTDAFGHLPLVFAANHSPAWALKQYYQLDTRFNSIDERIVALRIDSRGALDVELINGLQIKLGRGGIERKIDRLVRIYTAQILPRREQILRLDLRYSNGFAVAWKKEALRDTDKASIWSNSNV